MSLGIGEYLPGPLNERSIYHPAVHGHGGTPRRGCRINNLHCPGNVLRAGSKTCVDMFNLLRVDAELGAKPQPPRSLHIGTQLPGIVKCDANAIHRRR